MFTNNEHEVKMNANAELTEKTTREQEILDAALNAFREATGLEIEKGPLELVTKRQKVDAVVQLKAADRAIDYLADIKPTLTATAVGRFAHEIKDQPVKWLIVTTYVPTYLAKKMRDLGTEFIDTVGNAYVNEPPILIFTHGNRPPKEPLVGTEEGMFGRAGLRVVFALLCKKELEGARYREIAGAANVALGTVAGVMNDLTQQQYMVEMGGRGRRLVKKKELLDKWTTAYAERIRQKRLIGRYTADRINFWQDVDLTRYHAQWGGEVAANKMVHYLKPEIITIYTRRPVNELVLDLKLRRNEEGKVELRERFWRFENGHVAKDLVPPLLVYADLLATADARSVETAKMVYNEYLQRHLIENSLTP